MMKVPSRKHQKVSGREDVIVLIAYSDFSMAVLVMSACTACSRATKSSSLLKELGYFTHPVLKVSGRRLAQKVYFRL